MLKLENIEFDLPTMNKNPTFGYEREYKEYTMLSGKKRRVYKPGKRLVASYSYAYLTDEQLSQLGNIMTAQQKNGYVNAEINMPGETFVGKVNISIDNSQTRFAKINGRWVWIDYKITLQGVDML